MAVPDNEHEVSLVERSETDACTVEPTAPEVGLSAMDSPAVLPMVKLADAPSSAGLPIAVIV